MTRRPLRLVVIGPHFAPDTAPTGRVLWKNLMSGMLRHAETTRLSTRLRNSEGAVLRYADIVGIRLVHPFEGDHETVRLIAEELHDDLLNVLRPLSTYI